MQHVFGDHHHGVVGLGLLCFDATRPVLSCSYTQIKSTFSACRVSVPLLNIFNVDATDRVIVKSKRLCIAMYDDGNNIVKLFTNCIVLNCCHLIIAVFIFCCYAVRVSARIRYDHGHLTCVQTRHFVQQQLMLKAILRKRFVSFDNMSLFKLC